MPPGVVVARSDAERFSERVEVGRRERGNQDRGQFCGIEWSLLQANAFGCQDSQRPVGVVRHDAPVCEEIAKLRGDVWPISLERLTLRTVHRRIALVGTEV